MNAFRSRVFCIKLRLFGEKVIASNSQLLAVRNCFYENEFSRCFCDYKGNDIIDESDYFTRTKGYARTARKGVRFDSIREEHNPARRQNNRVADASRSKSGDRKVEPYKVYNYNYFAKGRNESERAVDSRFKQRMRFQKLEKKFSDEFTDEFVDEGCEADERGNFEESNSFDDENRVKKHWKQKKVQAWKANLPRYSVKIPGISNVQEDGIRKKEGEFVPNPYNVTEENRFKVLSGVISPLHMYSYDHQLNDVYQRMVILLKKLNNRLSQDGADLLTEDSGLLCELDFTKGSPLIDEYRNKDEFIIWHGIDGNPKTVGFLVGEPSKHTGVVCVEPDELKTTKKSHRQLARLFQIYLREWSPYDVCTDLSGGGNWRRFIVRSNTQGEHMLIAIMHPQDLNYDKIQEEKDRLKNYFQPLADEHQIKSLYFQACPGVRCSHEVAPFQLLFGDPVIKETLNNLTFQLSPESFFQVNTSAAVVLYNTILDELNLSKDLTVIDLCCGTGVISLHVAPHVQRVIGIERSKAAIDDAKKNAAINGIRNCHFINGNVEEILPNIQSDLTEKKVVVIANPGRDGLPMKVISLIRSMEFVQKLVFISCNPEGNAFNNFRSLMMPEFHRNICGKPFVASHAVPVHLFPSTNHCELIIAFDRILN